PVRHQRSRFRGRRPDRSVERRPGGAGLSRRSALEGEAPAEDALRDKRSLPAVRAFRFLTVLLLPGCIGTRMVPPPGEPAAIPPTALRTEDPPPTEGKGRVVLDVVGTVATAFEIREKKDDPDGRSVEALCETPCAVSLARGKHQIAFASPKGLVGRETVEV